MLAEPDLFSSVPNYNHNKGNSLCSQSAASANFTNFEVAAVECFATNSDSDLRGKSLTHLSESERSELTRQNIQLRRFPQTVATDIPKGHLTPSYFSASSIDPSERRVRRWYLTVIVLLYVGLITSFCLNVSLLLKSYPEQSSAEISVSKHQLSLDESELTKGNYISPKLY